MFQPIRFLSGLLPARIRAGVGRRSAGIGLALLLEGLLLLAMLTLGQSYVGREETSASLSSFDIGPEPDKVEAQPESEQREARPSEPERAPPPPPDDPPPAPEPPPLIAVSREQMAVMDIANLPSRRKAPPAPNMAKPGPPDTAARGDTPRIGGTGPNGEPLYAAAWYREPYDSELRGYLSTASGPGWGLIACRTVHDYRVDDCVIVDEYPTGSNIARSVLEAAWQFRVRPPRLGGRSMIGEWVGIRIDYDLRR